MSWLFSQALVEEYSAGTSLAGQPCAQLNVMPTPRKFWRNDKTMEPFALSLFGLTLHVLTGAHGEKLLMSYLAAFRAKTSASPEKEPVLTVNAVACGSRPKGSFAKFDQDTYTWKTAQCSLFGGLCRVLGDLAALGFDAEWGVFSASEVGAPHERLRIWILAKRQMATDQPGGFGGPTTADAERWEQEVERHDAGMGGQLELGSPVSGNCTSAPGAGMGGVVNGLAGRMDRLKALGNGQVPRVCALAFNLLSGQAK